MQLEQQETFEIKGPQLEVFGEVESKLPAPVKKKPVAAGFLVVLALLSVFGIGGAKLKGQYQNTMEIYTSVVDEYGNGIQTDFDAQADAAANLIRAADKVMGEHSGSYAAYAQECLDVWNDTPRTPAAQYVANKALYGAVDTLYNTAEWRQQESDSSWKQIEGLYQDFVSCQSTISRATANDYNPAAQKYNKTTSGFPANLIGTVWGVGEIEQFAAPQ